MSFLKRTHTCGELSIANASAVVRLNGWVHRVRDQGGVVFIDLRDRYGLTQLVFSEHNPEAAKDATSLRPEDIIAVEGEVARRDEDKRNPKLATGEIEIIVRKVELLTKGKTPPFEVSEYTQAGEDVRMKYRFIDLRRAQMQQNLITRHKLVTIAHEYFNAHNFIEVETPFLTKSTPEGARDFLVPSRLQAGHFYALPQSPQIFKQLLMVSGMDRYFQVVKCFRDEDLRADRQPEFTQFDVEMSFIDEEDVYEVIEGFIARVFKEIKGVELSLPLMRLSYEEAMNKYGKDSPDLRYELFIEDVTELAGKSGFGVFSSAVSEGGVVKGIRVKGAEPWSRKEIDALEVIVKENGAKGLAWFKVRENEIYSPIAKFFSADELKSIVAHFEAEVGDMIFFGAGPWKSTVTSLGALRTAMAKKLELTRKDDYKLLWVTDFPAFEFHEEDGRYYSMHHPFTSPRPEDVSLLDSDPGKVLARAYDLVLNGSEIGGGSIRIHRREVQAKVFDLLGISREEAEERFSFLLGGLEYGAPPHGGIALGVDRIAMLLAGADSLRDVIAFPKTASATCLLSGAPSIVDQKQLDELHLKTK
ncbi:MAG: aspartate--tRNA ligase [Planctomycetes bacterium]|nr:aspartate--tRNA ligase [Planctomycetota bacterium]